MVVGKLRCFNIFGYPGKHYLLTGRWDSLGILLTVPSGMPSPTLCPYLTQALGLVGLKFLSTPVTGAAEGPNEVIYITSLGKAGVY